MPTAPPMESPPRRGPSRRQLIAAALFLLFAASRWIAVPADVSEVDEVLFCFGVEHFDMPNHHPHPPGYPVYVAMGKLLTAAGLSPFRALTTLGLIASTLLAVPLYRLARSQGALGRLESVLVVGLFGFSPVVWLNSARALSDMPAAAMSIFAACWLWSLVAADRSRPKTLQFVLAAGFCALSIGVRPQIAAMLVPLLLFAAWKLRPGWRATVTAIAAFAIGCASWLAPMIALSGGWSGFWSAMAYQAKWYARYDTLFGGGQVYPWSERIYIWTHPWGLAATAWPILAAALVGVIRLSLRRRRAAAFLLVWWLPFSAFLLIAHSPESPRYLLPALAPIAVAAMCGLAVAPQLGRLAGTILVVGLIGQGAPWVWRYHTKPAPPLEAADWVADHLDGPEDRVLLDKDLEVLLSRHPIFKRCEILRNPNDVTAVDKNVRWILTPSTRPLGTPAFSTEWTGLRLRRFTRHRFQSGYVYPTIGTEP